MAVTLASLQARIAEAKRALSKPGHLCVRVASSKAQASALADMVSRCDLNAEDTSTFMNDVSDCNFEEADMQRIISASQKLKAEPCSAAPKKLGQNYVAMHVLMYRAQQDMMMSADHTREEKLITMYKLLANAGMRKGDEFTYQRLNDIVTVHSTTRAERGAYTPRSKWCMKDRVKEDFLLFAKNLEPPQSMCVRLPLDCAELKRDHPQLYQNVFDTSHPQHCQLMMQEVEEFSKSYSVRNEGLNARVKKKERVSQAEPAFPAFNMDNCVNPMMSHPFGAMIGMVMQHIKSLQETQITYLQNGPNNKLNALCDELPYRRSRSNSQDRISEEHPTRSGEIAPLGLAIDPERWRTIKASNPQETNVETELNNAQRTTAPIEPQTCSGQGPQQGDATPREKPSAVCILEALKERQSEKNKIRKEKAAAEKLAKQAEGSDAHEKHERKAEISNHGKVAASSETKKANAKKNAKRPCEETARAKKDKYQ